MEPSPRPEVRAVIFDMDGCLVDSEPLSLEAVAAEMRHAGLLNATAAEVGEKYLGVSLSRIIQDVEDRLGRPCPPDFIDRMETRLFKAYKAGLQPINGADDLLVALAKAGIAVAIASGASVRRLDRTLEYSGLDRFFPTHRFSADLVSRGKPAPDVFLLAAERLGVAPQHCVVLEDSPHGIKGAVDAGMRAVGFVGGSHLIGRESRHAVILREAGAAQTVHYLSEAFDALVRKVTLP
ncbi:HAD family phosphatase [Pseudotabrizicola sp.]|uniref:HAD family hydrolase n=1 Tax=Pseudotabrizicola sp. TaxID=2939647 RepID=UPI002725F357|nr:HAD family phosphatase [Pseudotabrizicola sp.]MDO8883938.1 HAD family phosphatase [Pseudotabrizicola sp.]